MVFFWLLDKKAKESVAVQQNLVDKLDAIFANDVPTQQKRPAKTKPNLKVVR